MKAILVIDLPVALVHLLGEEIFVQMSHRDGRYITTVPSKLKLLPQKIDISEEELYEKQYMCFEGGWNACLDEILGETE